MSRDRLTQYALLGVIGLLLAVLFAFTAVAMRAPPVLLPNHPLLGGPGERLQLEAAYSDESLPLITTGAASATRGCAYAVLLTLAASTLILCELSAISAAAHRLPSDLARVACLFGATPLFAASPDSVRRFDSIMPPRWRFSECVASASRLKGLTVCLVGCLLVFSASCFSIKSAVSAATEHAAVFRAYPLRYVSGAWHHGPNLDQLVML